MAQRDLEKCRTFEQSPPPGSPEEKLERMVNDIFGEMRGRNGRALFYDERRGRVRPARTLGAKLARAKRKGVPRAQALKLVQVFDQYVNEVWPEPPMQQRRA